MARRSRKRAKAPRPPRISKRRRAARFGRLAAHRRALMAVAIVSSLGVGGWLLAHSSLFALDGLEVRGNRLLDEHTVVAASGLHVGMNLLSVDAGAVERSLEALAVVREAKVERLYPSRVRITVRERAPAVLVESSTGAWLAGDDGQLIVPADAAPPGIAHLRVDAPIGSPELTDALRLWAAIPAGIRSRVSAVEAAEPGALAVILDGIRVIFGTPDGVEAKLGAANAVIVRAKADGVRVRQIDVRVPRRPAARLG